MKNTLQKTSEAYSSLIGIPYSEAHCWEIVKRFYKIEFDIELNHIATEGIDYVRDKKAVQTAIWAYRKDFLKVESGYQFGDIVLMRIRALESHIGVYVGSNKLLHTLEQTGCVVDLLPRWVNNVVGVYRLHDTNKVKCR